MKRTIVFGDIHGCFDELLELVDKLKVTGEDHVISLGDMIDRGPKSAEVVRFCRSQGYDAVMGNHEAKMLKWFSREERYKADGTPNKMKPPKPERLAQWEALSVPDRVWLAQLPFMMKPLPDWYVVHAGFQDVPMDRQTIEPCTMVRFVDEVTGRFKGYENGSHAQPPGTVPWMTRWRHPEKVAYGHAVHSLEKPRIECRPVIMNGPKIPSVVGLEGVLHGMDTGCCFGGRLSALILETREVVQVQANRVYCDIPVVMT